MNKKLLNKVMKKLASSNVVISPTVKSSSPSLSMQKKPEMEQIQQKLEQYLLSRYHFRFNVLTEQTECCKKDADTPIYKVISQRTLNSLCLEARARHINCWDKDVSRFVNSEQMPDYHPLLSYMDALPEWDGMDRVTPLAQRISTKDFWVNSFHRWMLGVTAQWSGHMARCANAVAPMLVSSEQGRCKSTFCELLMPDSLKDYYTDSFELTGQAGCEQKLAFFGLINLDEYDRLSPQKLPLLKKSDADEKTGFPQVAPLVLQPSAPDGLVHRHQQPESAAHRPQRKPPLFLCRGKRKIDCSPLEHKQLFAQLKAELDEGKRYWFSAAEESELKLRNQAYYALPTEAEMILHCFRLPEKGEDFKLYSAVCLFNILLKRYPAAMRGITINKMGRIMNSLGAERMHTTTGNMYKLVALAG